MSNQKINKDFNKKLAECVGLWLAEGDNKTKMEITFSNNCWELVNTFHKILIKLLSKYNPKIRIYVYNSTKEQIKIPLKNIQVNYYIDKRATKPYYIWRLASVDLVKEWKKIVEKSKNDTNSYAGILRGFFAGEGTVKEGSHGSRVLRISQGKRLIYIDKILGFFEIDYKFSLYHRNGYIIHRKENFDRLAKIGIADLHPTKKTKFDNMLSKYKQTHYKKGHIKKHIKKTLKRDGFYTSEQLANLFDRSQDRVSEVLTELKKERLIKNFRVRSKDYWTLESKKIILISAIKYKYLNILKKDPKRTKDIAEEAGVCFKAAFNRLKELKKLGLVKRNKDKTWETLNVNKKVVVI